MVAYACNGSMQLLTAALDWCFPPRPAEQIVRTLTVEDLVPTPRYPQPDTTCLLPFAHPTVAALIHEAKFHHNRHAHYLLGKLTHQYLETILPDAIIIPVPLHPRRERKRGFNQVSACLNTQPILRQRAHHRLLQRFRNTAPQTTLSAEERQKNVRNAFTMRSQPTLPTETPLVLIDDVYTTGATLTAARRALRGAYPHHPIHCLTFAYA